MPTLSRQSRFAVHRDRIIAAVSVILLLSSGVFCGLTSNSNHLGTFKAAVFEHKPIVGEIKENKQDALKIMHKNIDIYEEQIRTASLQVSLSFFIEIKLIMIMIMFDDWKGWHFPSDESV